MEQLSDTTVNHEATRSKLKARLGRFATRTAVVTAATATIFSGITVGEVMTNIEQKAHADSPLDSMNGAEKAWCAWPSRWALCNRTQQLAKHSLDVAVQVGVDHERPVLNGGADAFRHCYWSGLMTKEFGWETAKEFGDRHEYNDDQHPFEAEVDLYNNRQGRIWAH